MPCSPDLTLNSPPFLLHLHTCSLGSFWTTQGRLQEAPGPPCHLLQPQPCRALQEFSLTWAPPPCLYLGGGHLCKGQLPHTPSTLPRGMTSEVTVKVGAGRWPLPGEGQAGQAVVAQMPPSYYPLSGLQDLWAYIFLSQHDTVVTPTVPRSPQPSPSQKVTSTGAPPTTSSSALERPGQHLRPPAGSEPPERPPPWLVDCGRVTGPGILQAFAQRCGGGKPAHPGPRHPRMHVSSPATGCGAGLAGVQPASRPQAPAPPPRRRPSGSGTT